MTRLCAALLALLVSGPVWAQAPAPVPVVQPGVWAGPYIGIGTGGVFDNHQIQATDPPITIINGQGAGGFLGHVYAGYDFLGGGITSNSMLFGIWVDGSIDSGSSANLVNNLRFLRNGSYSAGGRIGYLINQHLLVYGHTGFSGADYTAKDLTGAKLGNLIGFEVGPGIEYQIGNNTFAKVEYRYDNLYSHHLGAIGETVLRDTITDNKILVGISYKLSNGGGILPVGEPYRPLK